MIQLMKKIMKMQIINYAYSWKKTNSYIFIYLII